MRALINNMPGQIPSVTIEEIPELFVDKPNNVTVKLVLRSGKIDGSLTLSDYTRMSLLQGNECINIGEIKGAEAFDICDAYSTGHCGINTFHVEELEDSHTRFAFMASKNDRASNYSIDKLTEIYARDFDFVIYMENFKIREIAEIGFDTMVCYRTIYKYEEGTGFTLVMNYLQKTDASLAISFKGEQIGLFTYCKNNKIQRFCIPICSPIYIFKG
jgi:Flp pilus assembly CpaF family ATPase